MIYLTGDIHGHHTINKLASTRWPEGKHLTKDDYLIILGDFGLLWHDEPDANEHYWIDWLSNKPWTTLVVPGNHENWKRIYALPEVVKFDAPIKHYPDSDIYFMNRGEIYTIDNKTFFNIGGAFSIDRSSRILDKSWWEEEIPTKEEYEYGLNRLIEYNNSVDYILAHNGSNNAIEQLLQPNWNIKDPVSLYLDEIEKRVTFKKMYFGHWHKDIDGIKYRVLYHDIIALGE